MLIVGLCSRGSFWQLGFPGGASYKEPACPVQETEELQA